MLWLIASLILLQAIFHWLFEPIIQLLTPLFGLNFLPWILALIGLWLFTGRSSQ
jgi:hypothetical protein